MILFGSLLTLTAAYAAGVLSFRTLPLPRVARFGLGAAVESLLVFLLLQAGWGGKWPFLALELTLAASLLLIRPQSLSTPRHAPLDRYSKSLFVAVLGAYTAIYFVYALAPEVEPDAITYHLGLSSEYARLGHFPARVGFYEVMPQGLEMLFAVALSLGGFSAAKLVHFAFLIATAPLILATGRKLGVGDFASVAAAALYFCVPVAGISGTSAYTDAALVFFTVLTFYLLLLWQSDRRGGYLFAAGISAGFCFALKITGLPVVAAAAVAALIVSRRWKPALFVTAGASLSIAPWMLRDFLMTGNPVAPLLNGLFPNPYFNTATERQLSTFMRSYGNFRWSTAPVEYALRGGMQGVIGPIFLLLPLGLLSLRKRVGQLLFLAAAVVLVPWFWNVGTRFLMPCLPFLLLAFALSVPRSVLFICIAAQAILCWPPIIRHIEDPYRWTLRGIPVSAALRLQPEDAYLRQEVGEYPVARMVEERTGPGAHVFCLATTARAYTTRVLVDNWHSTPDERLRDALQTAVLHEPMIRLSASWPAEPLRGVRVTSAAAASNEWRIFELRLIASGEPVFPSPQWSLDANPYRWDAPAAFDENRATSWRTRDPIRRGMFLQATLNREQIVSGVEILTPPDSPPVSIQGEVTIGVWKEMADALRIEAAQAQDVRHEAVTAVRGAGFGFILAEDGKGGLGEIGADMLKHPGEWGVLDQGSAGAIHLFRIL